MSENFKYICNDQFFKTLNLNNVFMDLSSMDAAIYLNLLQSEFSKISLPAVYFADRFLVEKKGDLFEKYKEMMASIGADILYYREDATMKAAAISDECYITASCGEISSDPEDFEDEDYGDDEEGEEQDNQSLNVKISVVANSKKKCKDILSSIKWRRAGEGKSQVAFCLLKSSYIDSVYKDLTSIPFDSIKENYNESVVNSVSNLISSIDKYDTGIITLHGEPGTGKTYLIRSLLHEIRDKRKAIICSPASKFLRDANMLTTAMMTREKPIIILEDLGDAFKKDSAHMDHDQFNVLLNFTDGLFSLLREAIFILTFNIEHNDMNSAFLRPGRCIANIEVNSLPVNHVKKLLPGVTLDKREYTLAEVYAIKNDLPTDHNKKKKSSIGFSAEARKLSPL